MRPMQNSNADISNPVPNSGFTLTGIVDWFSGSKGYGFIKRDDGGADVFVHHTDITIWTKQSRDDTRRLLYPGERVEFDLVPGDRGKPAAKKVRVLNN
jgi:CspA family cold shock protein